jgi:rhodanese-related sulfurtransferase
MSAFTRAGSDEAHAVLDGTVPGQLVDVRETSEVDALRIEGALNLPLSRLAALIGRIDKTKPVFILCRSGARAKTAAEKLGRLGIKDIRVVDGGLDAWTKAGKPVVRGVSRVWAMERQVRFAAGSLVLAGLILAFTAGPAWLLLSAFVGAGLAFSAVTDTCTMALILARLPWNKGSGGSCGV